MSKALWLAVCEVQVEAGDLPSGATKAFVRVTTWANSLEEITPKVSGYLATFRWHLMSVEDAKPIDPDRDYGDETNDMIERARHNAQAIILGRFNSYREN